MTTYTRSKKQKKNLETKIIKPYSAHCTVRRTGRYVPVMEYLKTGFLSACLGESNVADPAGEYSLHLTNLDNNQI